MKQLLLALALTFPAILINAAEEKTISRKELVTLTNNIYHDYFKKTDYSFDSYFSYDYWQKEHLPHMVKQEMKRKSLDAASRGCRSKKSNSYDAECSRKAVRALLNSALLEVINPKIPVEPYALKQTLLHHVEKLMEKSKTLEDYERDIERFEKNANIGIEKCGLYYNNCWKKELGSVLTEITEEI